MLVAKCMTEVRLVNLIYMQALHNTGLFECGAGSRYSPSVFSSLCPTVSLYIRSNVLPQVENWSNYHVSEGAPVVPL